MLIANIKFSEGLVRTQIWPQQQKEVMENGYNEMMESGQIIDWWVKE